MFHEHADLDPKSVTITSWDGGVIDAFGHIRIPVRQHEPRRQDALNSGRTTLGWLRPGIQWPARPR